jgi:DNA-binding HxlR family transcriptional regulator
VRKEMAFMVGLAPWGRSLLYDPDSKPPAWRGGGRGHKFDSCTGGGARAGGCVANRRRLLLTMAERLHYGQFCPVAQAAEVVGERWTPLVLRELLDGSRRFNEIRRGVPKMSPSLLSLRLRQLVRAGVVDRRTAGRHVEYHLTPAGEELRAIIEGLGAWGKRWTTSDLARRDLDAGLLMWDVRRHVHPDRLPRRRAVVAFHFPDAPPIHRRFWLVVDGDEVDLCLRDPGHEVDLWLTADVEELTAIWLGDLPLAEALAAGRLRVDGADDLARTLGDWLGSSAVARIPRQRA